MKLIVGLGNPGKKYEKTRHNVGFMVLDALADKLKLSFTDEKFGGLYLQTIINGEKVILLKPQKYINLSGEVIKAFLDYFKIKIDDLFIIHDDLDLEIGTYKIKTKGRSAGHNGLKNIKKNLQTIEYKRLKIGISNNKDIDTSHYITSRFTKTELTKIIDVIDVSVNIILDFITLNIMELMNKYNKKRHDV